MTAKLKRDSNGEKLYYEGFLEDITDRKNKEIEIHNKMRMLQWHFDIAMERELKIVKQFPLISSITLPRISALRFQSANFQA